MKNRQRETGIPHFTLNADSALEIIVDGWAVEEESPTLPDLIYLRLREKTDNRYYEFAARRYYRGDVATALQNTNFRYAGFIVTIPARRISLALMQVTLTRIACASTGVYLNVSGLKTKRFPPCIMKCLLLQQWFKIDSDPELETQINDRISFKKFLGISFSELCKALKLNRRSKAAPLNSHKSMT